MSAMTLEAPANAPAVRTTTAAGRFATLLRREYWEHRGGFLWAPIWASGVMLFLTAIGFGAVLWHTSGKSNGSVHIGVPIKSLLGKITPDQMSKATLAYDAFMGSYWSMLQIVLFFVLFFYLIGALYDDRKDRSVLFWKSLPVSDFETVVSKVVTAAFVAPILSWAVSAILLFGVLGIVTLTAWASDVSPAQVVWGPAEPIAFLTKTLLMVPLNVVWSLPAIGWLLFASAFARSKPFLWAVALPVAVGVAISTFDVFEAIQIPDSWYWTHIAARILLGIVPSSWAISDSMRNVAGQFEGDGPPQLIDWHVFGALLSSPETWIGAVAGIALIVGAIWFRRARELAD